MTEGYGEIIYGELEFCNENSIAIRGELFLPGAPPPKGNRFDQR